MCSLLMCVCVCVCVCYETHLNHTDIQQVHLYFTPSLQINVASMFITNTGRVDTRQCNGGGTFNPFNMTSKVRPAGCFFDFYTFC